MDLTGYPKLSIRGLIGPKNAMMGFFGEEEGFCASDCSKFLDSYPDADTIVVEISSPGGYVDEGFEIYDLLKNCGKEVITVGYSVNSIATVVFLSGKKRFVSENCPFLVHTVRIDPMSLGFEPLTADDLNRLAAEAERTDKRIVDLYCSVLGEEKRSLLIALMSQETDLGAEKAIKNGFASGYLTTGTKKTESKTASKTKNICITPAFINYMETTQAEKLNTLGAKVDKILNAIGTWFKMKNEVTLETKEGAKLYVYTDTEDLVGKRVVTVDDLGVPTDVNAAAGEHELADGRVIVVGDDGNISEVKEAVDVTSLETALTTAQAQIVELTNKLSEKDTMINEKDTAVKGVVLELKNLKTEFEAFKKEVPGDPEKKDKTTVEKIDAEKFQNMSRSQKLLAIQQGKL